MSIKASEYIFRLLTEQRNSLTDLWVADLKKIWNHHYPKDIDQAVVLQQSNRLFSALIVFFAEHEGSSLPEIDSECGLAVAMREISASRAKAGFKPADTVHFVLVLKNTIINRLERELSSTANELVDCLMFLSKIFDRLVSLTFDSYVEARENIISQQSISLMELSTPVIRLWDRVLILPMIGVIDTLRARQFTERLLESIARYEATVTIIDITGVPVVDTSVARHIMKTVDAAQLLGTSIIMTGISPAGALTLTKLGVGFEGVITRASLRAGVAEALKAIGQRIVNIDGAGK